MTTRHIRERLEKELETNVGLKIEFGEATDSFRVSGRGEMHLGVLIEAMRREGYELAVSRPEVILKREGGRVVEPLEDLVLDIPVESQGVVFSSIGRRGAMMRHMAHEGNDRLRLEYLIPSRCLIGFKSEFLTITRGNGMMHHSFHGYGPRSVPAGGRVNGVLVAMEAGSTTGYAIYSLQERAVFFLGPGIAVYEGMIVGENSRDNDLVVNPCKAKKLSNMRSKSTDEALTLTPPRELTLEQSIEFIAEDELVEVTPKAFRLRKKILDKSRRKRSKKVDEEA